MPGDMLSIKRALVPLRLTAIDDVSANAIPTLQGRHCILTKANKQ